MKRKPILILLATVLTVIMTVLLLPPTPAAAWFSVSLGTPQHSGMARDSLAGLGWSTTQIGQIPHYADQLDLDSPHPSGSCHRITEYQIMYEGYGGEKCYFNGAETFAANYLTQARQSYLNGNKTDGDKYLGYAIHYIQDSVCPAHVFPFKDSGLFIGAHYNFESDSNSNYSRNTNSMKTAVQNALVTNISSSEDLMVKMKSAADAVFSFPCSYVREDGVSMGSPSSRGYAISLDYVVDSLEMASGLTKGAALWAISAPTAAPAITVQPSNQSVVSGSNVTFSAAATGNPSPTVQWQSRINSGSTWLDMAGATSNSLSFTAMISQNGYQYRAIFTNSAGTASTNAATLTVTAASNQPTVTGVNPNNGARGQSLTVTISGSNFTGAISVSFGAGITVRSFSVSNSNQINAKIAINKKAALGPREVSVNTSSGSGSKSEAFTVQ